ncbi:MAG: hypothetical protein SOV27_03275 [Eubacteriales bacterium]|nr:hypothetical protein [Eubacteriales bacterium]
MKRNKTPQSNRYSTGEKWKLLLDNASIIPNTPPLVNYFFKIIYQCVKKIKITKNNITPSE